MILLVRLVLSFDDFMPISRVSCPYLFSCAAFALSSCSGVNTASASHQALSPITTLGECHRVWRSGQGKERLLVAFSFGHFLFKSNSVVITVLSDVPSFIPSAHKGDVRWSYSRRHPFMCLCTGSAGHRCRERFEARPRYRSPAHVTRSIGTRSDLCQCLVDLF